MYRPLYDARHRIVTTGAALFACLVAGPVSADALASLAVPTPVSDQTMQVAEIPRPEPINTAGRPDCPHRGPGLERVRLDWVDVDGNLVIPDGISALIKGNQDIPEDLLINHLEIPADSELVFDDRASSFKVRDIRVHGALRLGSPSCRLQKDIEFIFDTTEDVSDPQVREDIHARAGLGLVAMSGSELDVFGTLFQPTWTRLAVTAESGDDIVELAESVDWDPGQEVVVVTSIRRDYPYQNQNEIRTIVSRPSAKSIQLDAPLAYLHYGGEEYQVEVGLLSRNIRFRTADSVLANAPGFGGHIMAQAESTRVSGVELRGLGQRNFLGRYPMHFHFMGDTQGESYFTDNSIRESNWRCTVVHRTDNAVISRNVAFDTFGHCFYLEDGVEEGNEISYNLAARIKIMGDVGPDALDALLAADQEGFVLDQSPGFVNPADRAAAGFYIPNANNLVFGNAASGGFAGYSFPLLPAAIGEMPGDPVPMDIPIENFDGNTAHSSGYFWRNSGCVYVGGVLERIDNGEDPPYLQYRSGRSMAPYLRAAADWITNTKTFLCTMGVMHWGHEAHLVNLEAWDVQLMAQLFGSASIESALVAGQTGNSANVPSRPPDFYQRGFRFYDTDTSTNLRGIVFRNFNPDPDAWIYRSTNSCALVTLTHSNQFTPQRMSSTADFHFVNVDHELRICHDDRGTLASRNFNFNDTDGTATAVAGDSIPAGPRIAGSGHSDIWGFSVDCIRDDDWGIWVCPQDGTQNIASIATHPNQDVNVMVYTLNGSLLGSNGYSFTEFEQAQITGPSETEWFHVFPGGVPSSFEVHPKQVPVDSFVVYSFAVPLGNSCSIAENWKDGVAWTSVGDRDTLLASAGPVYTTDSGVCYIRIPPADRGTFDAAGLSTPYQTWRFFPDWTSFTVHVGL